MGNNPSSSVQMNPRNQRISQAKEYEVTTVDQFNPNCYPAIDEEACEASEEIGDIGPLSISSGNDDDDSEINEGIVYDHSDNHSECHHHQLEKSNDFTAMTVAQRLRMNRQLSEGNEYTESIELAKRRRSRASTIGSREGQLIRQQVLSRQKIPTVFKFYWSRHNSHQPKEVCVGGSFNDWNLVPMNGSPRGGHWCIIIDLPEGEHQYKFKVDDQWVHNPNEKTMNDGMGGKNNVITVHKSDFEVFEALDMDCKDVAARKNIQEEEPKFGQETPTFTSDPPLFESPMFGRKDRGPPILPPQLLQVILNKDTPLSCEPTLLPKPNHVMLNHMYALSIKDNVIVMSTTNRYKKKCVTTVLYRPIEM